MTQRAVNEYRTIFGGKFREHFEKRVIAWNTAIQRRKTNQRKLAPKQPIGGELGGEINNHANFGRKFTTIRPPAQPDSVAYFLARRPAH